MPESLISRLGGERLTHSRIIAAALLLAFVTINAQPAELTATLRGHTKKILAIEFSHDGQIVATGSKDGTVRLWNAVTGESLATIVGDSEVSRVDWSSDDRKLAITYSGEKSWELAVWEVPVGQQPVLRQRVETIYRFEWSPDGKTFLTLDDQLNVNVWDVNSRQVTHTITPAFSPYQPHTVSFIANGQRILTASVDRPVQLWDVASGKLVDLYQPNSDIPGGNYPSPNVPLLSLDKRVLLSGNLNVYEAVTGKLLSTIDGGSSAISFSPDGNNVLTVRYDAEKKMSHRQSYLSLRRIDNGQEVSAFQVPEGIRQIVWSPDGKTLAIIGLSFSPRVIDATTGRENGRLPYGNCWPWTMCGSDGCEPLKFSADGALLLKEKEPLKLWDTRNVSLVEVLKVAHLPAVFSPTDGRLLATASDDRKNVLLWRLKQ